MTDEHGLPDRVDLALQAGRYKNERDQLRNRLNDLAALLTVAAEADETLDGREAPGLRTAAKIVRDQLERRPA